ncbi:MAG: beta-Ala-His dipeptidase, partial [Deferribacterota bacterium]|nr:beta-Ala-His dipeptidase [Deferribacterota bacterium]
CSPADMTFPLQLEINGGWLTANNTTLGADNGVGIALALTVLADNSIKHPPLEVLFTVEEETGLDGAKNLREDFIRYRKLINLDSEEEGVITVGCAGGGRSYINMPLEREQPNSGMTSLVISVNGLLGGHSGLEVDSRANPNKLMGEFLERASNVAPELRLVSIKSGEQDNVIPSESSAWIYIENENVEKLNNIKNELLNKWKDEFSDKEPHINIDIYKTEENYNPINKNITNNIIDMLNELPYGVIAWSKELEDTIETSVNISPVKTYENSLQIVMMSRSASIESLNSLQERIKEIATSFGASCENPAEDRYPPWEPNFDSKLLALAEDVYNSLYGEMPEIEVTHGGLETAVIGDIYKGMDMISVGPTIENAHSPEERLNIQSVEKFYNYLLELLEAL